MRNAFATCLIAAVVAGALITSTATPGKAADDPVNVIKYRQMLMKANGAHMGSIAMIAKGEVSYDSQNIENHADGIALMATLITTAFKENVGDAADTTAKPDIWSNWSQFEAKAQDLFDKANDLSEAAASGDQTRIATAVGATGKACGGCHDQFRVKKQN
jgi:cytochrome c556